MVSGVPHVPLDTPGNAKAPVETSPVSRGLPIAPELGKKKNPARGLSLGLDTGQAGLSDDDAESPLADKRGLIGASRMRLKRKST
jgi:hypothetical protein